jgi:hypothetical protein
MVLRRATSIRGALEGVGPENRYFFWLVKKLRFLRFRFHQRCLLWIMRLSSCAQVFLLGALQTYSELARLSRHGPRSHNRPLTRYVTTYIPCCIEKLETLNAACNMSAVVGEIGYRMVKVGQCRTHSGMTLPPEC